MGPVRSVRPADPTIVAPLGGRVRLLRGSPGAEALAREAPLTIVTENDTAVMYRRSGRAAPHNLYTSTAGLFSRVPAEAGSPRAFAPYLKDGENFFGPGIMPVANLTLVPAPYITAGYDWDAASRRLAALHRRRGPRHRGGPHRPDHGDRAVHAVRVLRRRLHRAVPRGRGVGRGVGAGRGPDGQGHLVEAVGRGGDRVHRTPTARPSCCRRARRGCTSSSPGPTS